MKNLPNGDKASNSLTPADDPETFKEIYDTIVESYDLDNPVDQIMANRTASLLMTLQYCQEKIGEYGLFTVHEDKHGQPDIKMNQLAYFVKQIESEFRSYVRMLRQSAPDQDEDGRSFSDILNVSQENDDTEDSGSEKAEE